MSQESKKWIVRNQGGHIYGPFVKDKVRELLGRGVLTGDEQVALYPVGDWMPMSSDAELYDLVLEALARPSFVQPQKPEVPAADQPKQESIVEPQESPFHHSVGETKSRKISVKKPKEEFKEQKPFPKTPPRPLIIELKEKAKIKAPRKNILPLILVLLAAFIFVYASRIGKKTAVARYNTIQLLQPKLRSQIDSEKSKKFLTNGWSYFVKDTFTNYVRAQESFVEAIEADYKNAEALAMLSYSYYELWPFAKQDGQDTATIQFVLQLVSKADPYGASRALAASVSDLILRREASAKSQIETALTENPSDPRFYNIKGDVFFQNSDYQAAIAYYQKAASLLNTWVKPIYMIGLSYSKLGDATRAQQFLVESLKMNPKHAPARLELGFVESYYFNQHEKGQKYLQVALDSQERFHPLSEARGRFQLGILLTKLGSKAEGAKQIKIAAALDPTNPTYKQTLLDIGETPSFSGLNLSADRQHMALGDQYMKQNEFLGAAGQFKAAFALNTKNSTAALRSAQALWALKQSNEAMEYLQRAIIAEPKYTEAYMLLAEYKSLRHDYEGANKIIAQAQRALKGSKPNYIIFRGSAEIALRQGDAKTADVFAEQSLKLYETDVESNDLMARIKLGLNDIDKASKYAKRAIDLDRGNSKAHVTFAKVEAQRTGVDSAIGYLKNLINTYPAVTDYRMGLAEIYLKDQQHSPAKQILEQVTIVNSSDKEAFLLLGDAHFGLDDLDSALASYLAAAKADPSDPSGLFRAGEVYLKAGKFNDAQEQMKLVVKTNPLFPLAHYGLARAYFKAGMAQEAIDELKEETKINPNLADPYEFLGDVYLSVRRFDEASSQYQKALSIKNQGAAIYVKAAKAYRGQGALDQAEAMLRLASAKESGFSEIFREQAYILETRGRAQEALYAFRQYLSLEPNPPDKQQILDKIQELE